MFELILSTNLMLSSEKKPHVQLSFSPVSLWILRTHIVSSQRRN